MKRIDLTGKKFGRWKILSKGKRSPSQEQMWKCVCKCGTKREVRSQALRLHRSKSCGCLKIEQLQKRRRLKFGLAAFKALYRQYQQNAKNRKLIFSINKKTFKRLTQQNCAYCGDKPKYKMSGGRGFWGNYTYNGLDRVNNNGGYTTRNVVTCCKSCNFAKNTLTLKEFKSWLDRLTKFRTKGEKP